MNNTPLLETELCIHKNERYWLTSCTDLPMLLPISKYCAVNVPRCSWGHQKEFFAEHVKQKYEEFLKRLIYKRVLCIQICKQKGIPKPIIKIITKQIDEEYTDFVYPYDFEKYLSSLFEKKERQGMVNMLLILTSLLVLIGIFIQLLI